VRLKSASLAVGIAFAVLAAGLVPLGSRSGPLAAQAQNLGLRTVTGSVVDGNSVPVARATVFLKNQKSKTISSYSTTEKGRFQFAQVNMNVDYDLWAEKNGRKTAVKVVSTWDTRKEFEVELKMK
jgi:hypothetical protein